MKFSAITLEIIFLDCATATHWK